MNKTTIKFLSNFPRCAEYFLGERNGLKVYQCVKKSRFGKIGTHGQISESVYSRVAVFDKDDNLVKYILQDRNTAAGGEVAKWSEKLSETPSPDCLMEEFLPKLVRTKVIDYDKCGKEIKETVKTNISGMQYSNYSDTRNKSIIQSVQEVCKYGRSELKKLFSRQTRIKAFDVFDCQNEYVIAESKSSVTPRGRNAKKLPSTENESTSLHINGKRKGDYTYSMIAQPKGNTTINEVTNYYA